MKCNEAITAFTSPESDHQRQKVSKLEKIRTVSSKCSFLWICTRTKVIYSQVSQDFLILYVSIRKMAVSQSARERAL